jgi:hypothetical protein
MRALCRHDARNPRRAQHVALFGVTGEHEFERLVAHDHAAFGDRDAIGRGFRRNIDHACGTVLAEMRELGLGRFL